jgi:hypothetical protein
MEYIPSRTALHLIFTRFYRSRAALCLEYTCIYIHIAFYFLLKIYFTNQAYYFMLYYGYTVLYMYIVTTFVNFVNIYVDTCIRWKIIFFK